MEAQARGRRHTPTPWGPRFARELQAARKADAPAKDKPSWVVWVSFVRAKLEVSSGASTALWADSKRVLQQLLRPLCGPLVALAGGLVAMLKGGVAV